MNHNEPLTPSDKDWYNAGIMAQRILQNDEIETLKAKLKQVIKSHDHLMQQLKEANEELDIKQSKIIALGDRIAMMMNVGA